MNTTPRFGLHQWTDATDPFTRAQINADFDALDTYAARFESGATLANRPGATIQGRFWLDRSTGVLYLDGGASLWVPVGSATVGTVRHTAAPGQQNDLTVWVGPTGATVAALQPDGRLLVAGTLTAGNVSTAGAVSAGSVAATGAVTAASVTASGEVRAGLVTVTGNVNSTSKITGVQVAAGNDVTAPTINATNYLAAGPLGAGITGPLLANGGATAKASTATAVPLVARGAAGQTGNLQEWQGSDGVAGAKVTAAAGVVAPKVVAGTDTAIPGNGLRATATSTTTVPIVAQGMAGQTGSLQEWWDSAGAMKARVLADGTLAGKNLPSTLDLNGLFTQRTDWVPSINCDPGYTGVKQPSMGTGAQKTAVWFEMGDMVFVHAYLKCGTSGTSAGVGPYIVNLPTPARPGGTLPFIIAAGSQFSRQGSVAYLQTSNGMNWPGTINRVAIGWMGTWGSDPNSADFTGELANNVVYTFSGFYLKA